MEKRIEICVGTDRAKNMRARLSLLVIDDNGKVALEHYHSVAIEPDADLAAIRAAVESHLAQENSGIPFAPWPKIPDAEWADVEAHCTIVHKPEIVAAVRARKAAERAKEEARKEILRAAEQAARNASKLGV